MHHITLFNYFAGELEILDLPGANVQTPKCYIENGTIPKNPIWPKLMLPFIYRWGHYLNQCGIAEN